MPLVGPKTAEQALSWIESSDKAFGPLGLGAGVLYGAASGYATSGAAGAAAGAAKEGVSGGVGWAVGAGVFSALEYPALALGPWAIAGAAVVAVGAGLTASTVASLGIEKIFGGEAPSPDATSSSTAAGGSNGLPDPFAGFTAPGTAPVSSNFLNFNSLPGGGTLGSSNPSPSGSLDLSSSQPNPGYQQPIFSTLGDGTNIGPYTPPLTGVTAPDGLGLGAPSPLSGSTIMPNEPLDLSGSGSSGMSSPSLTDPNYGFAPSTGVTAPDSLGTGEPSPLPGSDIMPNLPVNFDPNSNVPGVFNTSDASATGFSLNPGGYISPAAFGVTAPTGSGAASGFIGGGRLPASNTPAAMAPAASTRLASAASAPVRSSSTSTARASRSRPCPHRTCSST